MVISKYFTYFIIYSFMGWIYETLYCTIKTGKWDNRGFLYGPICPIYGVGGVSVTIIADCLSGLVTNYDYKWWQVFLVSFFGSIVLEYSTSWILEKLFHAYWWDYSDIPLNINGRVCLPCTFGFGFAGLFVAYVIAPFTRNLTSGISPLGYELIGLALMCVVTIDTTLTVSALTNFEKNVIAAENALNQYMDSLVDSIGEKKPTAEGAKELLTNSFTTMGSMSKAALRRVKGFRKPRKAQLKHMELSLDFIKGKISNFKE